MRWRAAARRTTAAADGGACRGVAASGEEGGGGSWPSEEGQGVLCVRGIGWGFAGDGESPAGGGRRKKQRGFERVRVSREGRNAPEGERRGGRGCSAGVASLRGHAGPASGRRRGDAAAADQPASPGRVTGEGERGLTGGPG
jgi:hypothetical protein